jgi:hypothetical protein
MFLTTARRRSRQPNSNRRISVGTWDAWTSSGGHDDSTGNTLRTSLCVGCFAAITFVTTVQAQTKETPADPRGQMGMMADCQKMMAGMKAGQEKLDDLIAKMNAATGQAKIDQMAAILTELAAQKKAMQAQMMSHGHQANSPADAPKK